MTISYYQVVGRKLPTETDPAPQIFRMRIFARDTVHAKSRFWYLLHTMSKFKKATGEILAVNQIREKNSRVIKNYGITIRYNSRSGTHNMYKEFRDLTLCGAVEQMYAELAGKHRVRFSSIQIVDTCIVPAGVKALARYNPEVDGDVPPVGAKRNSTKVMLDSKIKFPLPHRIQRPTEKKFRSTFKANRPTTFFA